MLAGRRPNSRTDRVVSGLTILLQGMPTFWVGIMLVLLFTADAAACCQSSGVGTPQHLDAAGGDLVAAVHRHRRSDDPDQRGPVDAGTVRTDSPVQGPVRTPRC